MTIKTPKQIAIRPLVGIESRLEELGITITSDVEAAIKRGLIAAIEADRAQRSKMEQFGTAVYEIMDGEEWSSDTTQYIGDAAHALGITFAAPEYDE